MIYYYKYCNDKPEAVPEKEYREWLTSDKFNFAFEDCYVSGNGHNFLIQASYFGVFDESELLRPFVLVLSQILPSDAERVVENITTIYYTTYDELISSRQALMQKIKNDLTPAPILIMCHILFILKINRVIVD